MTRAERFMSVWIENNGYQYDNFPVGECMQSYADHQLKAKMPTDEEIKEHFRTQHFHYKDGRYYKTNLHRIAGAKWLKQQIEK